MRAMCVKCVLCVLSVCCVYQVCAVCVKCVLCVSSVCCQVCVKCVCVTQVCVKCVPTRVSLPGSCIILGLQISKSRDFPENPLLFINLTYYLKLRTIQCFLGPAK